LAFKITLDGLPVTDAKQKLWGLTWQGSKQGETRQHHAPVVTYLFTTKGYAVLHNNLKITAADDHDDGQRSNVSTTQQQ
jgi:hypothetical protein